MSPDEREPRPGLRAVAAGVQVLGRSISAAIHEREVHSSAPGAMAEPLAALRYAWKVNAHEPREEAKP
ncbi:MAG: hypothetical protein AAFU73_23475 [Planctomycetota bacterium]